MEKPAGEAAFGERAKFPLSGKKKRAIWTAGPREWESLFTGIGSTGNHGDHFATEEAQDRG